MEQTAILKGALCPAEEDPAACEAALDMYWSQIGLAMYPVFLEANAVCGELGVCKKLATPTCDECVGSVALVAEVIQSEAKIADIIAFLQSDWCPSVAEEGCAGWRAGGEGQRVLLHPLPQWRVLLKLATVPR